MLKRIRSNIKFMYYVIMFVNFIKLINLKYLENLGSSIINVYQTRVKIGCQQLSLILLGLMQATRGKWSWPNQFWPTPLAFRKEDLTKSLGIMAEPLQTGLLHISGYMRIQATCSSISLIYRTISKNQKPPRHRIMKVSKCSRIEFESECWNTAEFSTLNPPTYP